MAFAHSLGLELDPWQEAVLKVESKRDVFNCSRQAGKSTTAAVLALHEAVYRPGSVTVLISPSQRQSSELFRKVIDLRQVMTHPPDLVEDNRLSMTVRGGGRVMSLPGSEATVRGISAVTLLVEDEASRVEDELHYSIKPMLATTNGRLLLMSTPFGKRGHFWDVWDQGEGWNRVKVTAADVPRISREFLEEERRSMPAWWFEQEYLCEFKEDTDSVFRYEDVAGAISEDVTPLFPEAAA
ncbi:MAG TPA: terminase family protein [Trueperaceae bacterium]